MALLTLGCCPSVEARGARKKWWQNAVIYEVYPQSFYDSDGDGFGDLKGIESKADYLSELGINAVWINPFFKSPLKDHGYDISNYTAIDPRFGSMQDFEDLLITLKNKHNIQLILDFVMNHSSDQHEWFKKSVQRIDPYTNYYIWADPKGWKNGKPVAPNNWESVFVPKKRSAWTWNFQRKQFYFHPFLPEQPDFNFRCPEVVDEMKNILTFWMDKGVQGFRLDAVPFLVEDEQLRDESQEDNIHTHNLPETYKLVNEIRAFLDAYSEKSDAEMFLTTEGYTFGPKALEQVLAFYGDSKRPGAHFPYNFLLLTGFDAETNAKSLNDTIVGYLDKLTEDQWPNWVSGNHDWPRITSRLGSSSAVDILNMLNLLLPGTASVFMGDEFGMDTYWNIDKKRCPPGVGDDYRTPSRTPFQWSNEKNAGFTTAEKPWLPANPEYFQVNVASQRTLGYPHMTTTFSNFKAMVALKSLPVFERGKMATYVLSDYIFAFTREDKTSIYLIVINLDKSSSQPINIFNDIPAIRGAEFIDVVEKSINLAQECTNRNTCLERLERNNFSMPPKSGMVVSFVKRRRRGEPWVKNGKRYGRGRYRTVKNNQRETENHYRQFDEVPKLETLNGHGKSKNQAYATDGRDYTMGRQEKTDSGKSQTGYLSGWLPW